MPRVRVREQRPASDGAAEPPAPTPVTPLAVSGLVVTKAALIETLSAFVPRLRDVVTTEDGQHFWLMIGDGGASEGPAPQ